MTEAGARSAERAAFVEAFTEGWRAPAGADAFSNHFERWFTSDVRLVQPQVPTIVGPRGFREDFARPIFALIPDLHARVHRWAPTDDGVLIEFTLSGTLGGKPITWDAVDRVTLRDGLMRERRSYFDPAPILVAVATRPRAWRRFARLQLHQLRNRLRKDHR